MQRTTRRRFIQAGAGAGAIALAGCSGDDDETPDPGDDGTPEETPTPEDTPTPEPDEDTYEIWAADQGTDAIYIYEPGDGEAEFEEVDTIDTGAEGGNVPHMVDFSSDYEYAAIACTAGARTLIYRTEDRELVANLETGPSSHFAGFTPDDEYVVVDVIGGNEIVRVDADLEAETFEIEDEISMAENDAVAEAGIDGEASNPVCHSYDHEGRSIHTLGPSYHDGAVVIVDHEDFTVDAAFTHDELPANCGTMPHPTEDKFYLTAGLPSDEDEDGVGDYYVLDTENDEVVAHDDTGGIDAHGFWWTTDGEELWVLNRETNDGVILDPETDEVIEEIDEYAPGDGEKPDIMWGSPDGEYMFVTLRGPEPQSAAHVATGDTPGFSVLDTETAEVVTVVEPDPIDDYTEDELADDEVATPDFHGIGVRPIGDYDGYTSPPF